MADNQAITGNLIFTNYTYSYTYFSDKYKKSCEMMHETMSLRKVKNIVSTFVYEFSSAIEVKDNWYLHKAKLEKVTNELLQDQDFQRIMKEDDLSKRKEFAAYKKYYYYYTQYLTIFSEFLLELKSTLLPATTMTEKRYVFKNDNPFYQKYHELKNAIFEHLSDFSIVTFRKTFNSFLIYYHALNIYINVKDRMDIEKYLTLCLEAFTSSECIKLLENYDELSNKQMQILTVVEDYIHKSLLECDRIMNINFSEKGLNARESKKEHIDRWLI